MPTVGTTYVTANLTSDTLNTDTYDLTNGAYLFLAPYVDVINEGGGNGVDLNFVSTGFAQIDGLVNGSQPIYFAAADGSTDIADIKIAATGVIEAGLPGLANGSAIGVASGQYQISNAGDVEGNIGQFAVLLNLNLANTARGSGGGTLVNTGVIASVGGSGVANFDTASTDSDIVVNDGSIVAGRFGLDDEGGHVTTVSNYGHIVGGVCAVYAGGSESLTNAGTLTGAVNLGLLSTITNSGEIDGAVTLAADDYLVNSGKIVGVVSLGVGASLSVSGEIDGAVTLAGPAAGSSTQVLISSSGVLTSNAASTLAVKTGVYDIVNAGDIENTLTGVNDLLLSGSGTLVNSGTIASHGNAVSNNATTGYDYLYNSGTIAGIYDGVYDAGGHVARIVNQGTISGGSTGYDDSIYADIVTQTRLVNGGTISGDVELDAAGSTIVNSGAIDGDIYFGFIATQVAADFGSGVTASGVSLARSGSDRFVNSGSVDGNITFIGVSNVYLGKGGSFTGTLTGTGVDGRYYAGAGVESFDLSSAGAALAVGGTGETTFDYGATYNNSMAVQGGTGTTIVDVEGNYTGLKQIFLGARAMVGVSKIVFGAGFSYSLSVNAATVVNGATMTVDASQVGAGQTALLNISKDVGGFYDFIGGAGDDTITCAANNLFANDVFLGGTSASNIINFKTAGTALSQSFANVSGFSIINVASGTNDIQLNDLMVTKANASHSVYLNLSTGADTIDASLLITSTNNVTVNTTNASGGDTFIFGAAKETVILPASASSSVNYDTISNFNFGTGTPFDSLYVAGYTANAIDASVSGSLSTASFDADLATALAGHLNNGDALLFTANAGTLAGDTFLIASTNHAAGYAAGDLVVRLTGTTTGTLATANV